MSASPPAVSPAERFRSGISTLRAVLIVDLVFDLLNLVVLHERTVLGRTGAGIALAVTLLLLYLLRGGRFWRWALAGWVAADLLTLGLEAQSTGRVSMWLLFTIIVAAYVGWACATGERGMREALPGELPDARGGRDVP